MRCGQYMGVLSCAMYAMLIITPCSANDVAISLRNMHHSLRELKDAIYNQMWWLEHLQSFEQNITQDIPPEKVKVVTSAIHERFMSVFGVASKATDEFKEFFAQMLEFLKTHSHLIYQTTYIGTESGVAVNENGRRRFLNDLETMLWLAGRSDQWPKKVLGRDVSNLFNEIQDRMTQEKVFESYYAKWVSSFGAFFEGASYEKESGEQLEAVREHMQKKMKEEQEEQEKKRREQEKWERRKRAARVVLRKPEGEDISQGEVEKFESVQNALYSLSKQGVLPQGPIEADKIYHVYHAVTGPEESPLFPTLIKAKFEGEQISSQIIATVESLDDLGFTPSLRQNGNVIQVLNAWQPRPGITLSKVLNVISDNRGNIGIQNITVNNIVDAVQRVRNIQGGVTNLELQEALANAFNVNIEDIEIEEEEDEEDDEDDEDDEED